MIPNTLAFRFLVVLAKDESIKSQTSQSSSSENAQISYNLEISPFSQFDAGIIQRKPY